MGVKLSFLIVFVLLLTGNHSLNWMAYGNFTPDNMTIIWGKINSIDRNIQKTAIAAFTASFSDYLTNLWDPAWNVVICYYTDGQNYDAVINGYAFRSHWFWVNGFQLNLGYTSIGIWKDYNCVRWLTFDGSISFQKTSTYSDDLTALLGAENLSGGDLNNIWKLGNDYLQLLLRKHKELLQDAYAYTVIPTQNYNNKVFFKACIKDYVMISSITDQNNYQGAAIIMQMR